MSWILSFYLCYFHLFSSCIDFSSGFMICCIMYVDLRNYHVNPISHEYLPNHLLRVCLFLLYHLWVYDKHGCTGQSSYLFYSDNLSCRNWKLLSSHQMWAWHKKIKDKICWRTAWYVLSAGFCISMTPLLWLHFAENTVTTTTLTPGSETTETQLNNISS